MRASPAVRTVRSAALATCALLVCTGGLRLCWAAAASPLEAVQASGPDAPVDLIVVGAAAGGALLLAWLGLGAMLAALAATPGAVGRLAGAATARVAPAVVRRATAVLLGTALATAATPLAQAAEPQPPPSRNPSTGQAVGLPAPDPGFGVTVRQPVADGAAPDPGGPAPASTAVTAPDPGFGVGMPAATPAPAVSRPVNSPSTATGLGPLGPAPQERSLSPFRTVTVMQGDSLWAIAARHLGHHATPLQVAREWPRWYAANRAVIGPNPNLIRVGQVLTVPTPGAP